MTIDIPQDNTPARIVGGIPYFEDYLRLAERLCKTAMVPGPLKGKPDEVLAVVMYGAELGIGPMQALQQINFIAGKPSAAAELLRALVLEAGHQFIVTADTTKAVARCKRKNWEDWQETTFTMDDAHRANLGSGDGWKKYPDQMLSARVTSKACRMYFPDVISGMSYTPEEVTEFSRPEPVKRERVKEPEKVQRSAPVSRESQNPASEAQRQQIKEGLEMLAQDERADFANWWEQSGITRGVQNLSAPEAETVWERLFTILNEPSDIVEAEVVEPSQGNLAPSEAILDAFPGAVEVEPRLLKTDAAPNPDGPSQKQMDFIRKLCDQLGVDTYDKASNVLECGVTSLKALSKAQAKKLIDVLIAETKG